MAEADAAAAILAGATVNTSDVEHNDQIKSVSETFCRL